MRMWRGALIAFAIPKCSSVRVCLCTSHTHIQIHIAEPQGTIQCCVSLQRKQKSNLVTLSRRPFPVTSAPVCQRSVFVNLTLCSNQLPHPGHMIDLWSQHPLMVWLIYLWSNHRVGQMLVVETDLSFSFC